MNVHFKYDIIDEEMEVFDIDILLTIVLKHSVQKSSIQENFDDCFKAEAKKTLRSDAIKCYLEGEISNKCIDLGNKESFGKVANFLNNGSLCKVPESVMVVKARKSNRNTRKIIDVTSRREKTALVQDLGISNKPFKQKPAIDLIFASITNISQVIRNFIYRTLNKISITQNGSGRLCALKFAIINFDTKSLKIYLQLLCVTLFTCFFKSQN